METIKAVRIGAPVREIIATPDVLPIPGPMPLPKPKPIRTPEEVPA